MDQLATPDLQALAQQAKQMRQRLLPIANRFGARIKVAEVPPGPPVLQTLVAEVYGHAMPRNTGSRESLTVVVRGAGVPTEARG